SPFVARVINSTLTSERKKILKQLLAGLSEHRLRMELDAFQFAAPVADAHDDAVIGFRGDGEFARQRLALDNQRMITGSGEGIRQLAKHALCVVMDAAGLPVK